MMILDPGVRARHDGEVEKDLRASPEARRVEENIAEEGGGWSWRQGSQSQARGEASETKSRPNQSASIVIERCIQ